MTTPSTKVTASSAAAGTTTALLWLVQQAQTVQDLPGWLTLVLSTLATGLATLLLGYRTSENNPAPSTIDTIRSPESPVRRTT